MKRLWLIIKRIQKLENENTAIWKNNSALKNGIEELNIQINNTNSRNKQLVKIIDDQDEKIKQLERDLENYKKTVRKLKEKIKIWTHWPMNSRPK